MHTDLYGNSACRRESESLNVRDSKTESENEGHTAPGLQTGEAALGLQRGGRSLKDSKRSRFQLEVCPAL